jgi:hypothetical protein
LITLFLTVHSPPPPEVYSLYFLFYSFSKLKLKKIGKNIKKPPHFKIVL